MIRNSTLDSDFQKYSNTENVPITENQDDKKIVEMKAVFGINQVECSP